MSSGLDEVEVGHGGRNSLSKTFILERQEQMEHDGVGRELITEDIVIGWGDWDK